MTWPYAVSLLLEWLWLALGSGCLAAALLLALRPAWHDRLESRLAAPKARRKLLAFFAVVAPAAAVAFKLAQYAAFQTMGDTAAAANSVWNFAHGYGLIDSPHGGMPGMAIHFAFTLALLAPLIRVWGSTAILIAAQGLAVGSAPLAVYLFMEARTRRPLWAALAGLLAFSSPLLHWPLYAMLDNSVFALPLFLWMAYFWEIGAPRRASAFALLLLTTREQIPFLFFGFGLSRLARAGTRRAEIARAFAIMAASVLLWFTEMAVIRRALGGRAQTFDFWSGYTALGGSRDAVLATIVHRPWLLAWTVVHPWSNLALIGRNFLENGLTSLAAGPALFPLLAVWAPQLLADPGSLFHHMREHYASFIAGPLLWTAAIGAATLLRSAKPARAPMLAAWLLAVSGVDFLRCGTRLLPRGTFPPSWSADAPRAIALIPPDAKVWCDQFLSPQLAMRRSIRILPEAANRFFDDEAFVPDRVLLSLHWIAKAEPEYRDRILGALRKRGFAPVFQGSDLILLAPPPAPN
jgi:hypothetical protein